MKKISDSIAAFIQAQGRPLGEIDSREIAFARPAALRLVALLRDAGFSILGADAYISSQEGTMPIHGSWSHEGSVASDPKKSFDRAAEDATQYIRTFSVPDAGVVLFSLVVDELDFERCYKSGPSAGEE